MAVIAPNPAMQDLKLTIHESTLILPLQETKRRAFYLSNMDQLLNDDFPVVYFFAANPDYPPHLVAEKLRLALRRVLVVYDYMAGRLKMDDESGRLEIDCNDGGAGFVVASSELSLDQIGNLVYPNLGFRQLVVRKPGNVDKDDQPLFILQVTSFNCGGFAIGLCINHTLLDGKSAKEFTDNLASQAFDDKPLAVVPFFDRRLLAARSPPQVLFEHREFFAPDASTPPPPPPVDCSREELEYRVFQLNPSHIDFLKSKANQIRGGTTLNVVAALMWRCKALSRDKECDGERVSNLLNVIDLRSRLRPPLPPNFCGNPLLAGYASSRCGDIERMEFADLVGMVAAAPGRVTDEYARSATDWLEVKKGVPHGEYVISTWMKLGFEEVVFPWGKALHAGPVASHWKDICWLFPTVEGVNALVQRPPPEIERFEAQFRKFFGIPIVPSN